jgi:hypothetical protein
VLGNLTHGRAPLVGLGGAVGVTLAQFIEDSYRPWLMANRPKGAKRTLQRIATCFGEWYSKPLGDITVELIEHWRTRRLSTGTQPLTILRDVMTLSGVLTRAVRLGKLPENVVRRVERPRIDHCPKGQVLGSRGGQAAQRGSPGARQGNAGRSRVGELLAPGTKAAPTARPTALR